MDIENKKVDLSMSLPFDDDNNSADSSGGISKTNDSSLFKKKKQLTFKKEVKIGGSDDGSIGVDDCEKENNKNNNNMDAQSKTRRYLIDSVGVGSLSTPTLGGSSKIKNGLMLNEITKRPKSDGGTSYLPNRPAEVYDEPFPKSFQKYEPIRLSACKRSLPTLQEYTYYDANFISPSVSLNYLATQGHLSPNTRFLLDKLDGVVYEPPADEDEEDDDHQALYEFDDDASFEEETPKCRAPGKLFKRMNKSVPNLKWDTSEEDQDHDMDSQSDNENTFPVTSKFNFSECSLNLPMIDEEEQDKDVEVEEAVNMKSTNNP